MELLDLRDLLDPLDQLVQLIDPQLYLHLQKADSTNFFFFFRMLLVWYKREFEWMDVLRLWEVLWTDWLSGNFHLFIALAVLEKHREVIMEHLQHFDEVLKYVNELSNTIDLESTLIRAETLFRRFQRVVEAIDRKGSFPAPKVRQRRLGPASPGTSQDGKITDTRATPALIQKPSSPTPPTADSSNSGAASSSIQTPSEVARGKRKSVGEATLPANASPLPKEKIISPELRDLQSRKPPKLDKEEVREHGGGVGS